MPKALCAWGGWEGHTPEASMSIYVPLLQAAGFEVDVVNGSEVYADAARLAQYQLIVQCITMASIKPEEEKGLTAAVKAGAGLAGWHGGLADSFRQNTEYQSAWARGSGLTGIVGAGNVAAPPPPFAPKAPGHGFRAGQSVFHNKFGEGVIVTLEGSGADARAQINFGRHGAKWLALGIAKLTAPSSSSRPVPSRR